jgi:glycosyltransferase involved in cell wall biosynthesis
VPEPPLRIGVIAPPWLTVPPEAYGGTELMIDVLCTGLQRAGHDVVLFTVGDSTCQVERRWLFAHADPNRMGTVVAEIRHAAAAYDALHDVDVIHDHTLGGLFISEHYPRRQVVTTIHGPFDADLADIYHRIDQRIPIVAISHDQARYAPAGLKIARVIHHGIDVDRYPFRADAPDGHMMVLGRMSPDKGIQTAITAARTAGVPLIIAAKMREQIEFDYFTAKIEPELDDDIRFVGEVGFDEKTTLLSTARALLNPIQWPEPFGLVMIEAMACGTPVIGFGSGAAPEIVDHGITGFLEPDIDGLIRGLRAVDTLDRSACRAAVETRFSAARMVADYVDFYRSTLNSSRPGTQLSLLI